MSNLKNTIEALALQFAASILTALRSASIDELTGASGLRPSPAAARPGRAAPSASPRKRGRLGRRTTDDIGRMVERIVGLLEAHPEGLRAEQIRAELGCQAKELPRPLAEALNTGRVSKSGQKRATTYFAGAASGSHDAAPSAKRRSRGGRPKRA